MKIVLIKPIIGEINIGNSRRKHSDFGRMEPLELAVIAGLTEKDVEVKIIDERIEDIYFDQEADLIAITVEVFTARRSYQIAEEFRKRGKKVILGGIHVSLIPEEASQYADAVFIGDAEGLWQQVVKDLKNGKLQKKYISKPGIQKKGVFPRRDLFHANKYLPISLIQFGRGCLNACRYCAVCAYFNKNYFYRDIASVIEEIKTQERKLFFFVDDNIVADKIQAKKLFKSLMPLKIKWVGQASIDMTKDLELMHLMKKSGCLGHVIGFEAITYKALKNLNKTPNLSNFNNYKKEIKILKNYGIQIWGAFTLGHDEETIESIEQTYEFAKINKFTFAAFNILTPYPGTPLYEDLKKNNRLLYNNKWWLHPDYKFNNAVFIPKKISPEKLTAMGRKLRQDWSSWDSMFYRIFNLNNFFSIWQLKTLWQMSYLFRKENKNKRDMTLGVRK